MPVAQQYEVREAGRAALRPVLDVMRVDVAALRAAGKTAAAVARPQRAPDRRRHRAGLAADIERLAVAVLDDDDALAVAGQPPCRLDRQPGASAAVAQCRVIDVDRDAVAAGGAGGFAGFARHVRAAREPGAGQCNERIGAQRGPALFGELGRRRGVVVDRGVERPVEQLAGLKWQLCGQDHRAARRVAAQAERPARVPAQRVVERRIRAVAQFAAAFVHPRRGRAQREGEQRVLVVTISDARQCANFRIGQLAAREGRADGRQRLQRVRDPHFLAGRVQAQIAAPGEPLGAVGEAPLEPAAALVEAADEHQQVVGRGVDAGGEADDCAVDLVDGFGRRGRLVGGGHGALRKCNKRAVIIYSNA